MQKSSFTTHRNNVVKTLLRISTSLTVSKAQCRMIDLLLSNETLNKWLTLVSKAFLPLCLLRCMLYTCMQSNLSINVGYLKNICERYIIYVNPLLNYLFYSLSRNGIIHCNDTCICS